jgi:hypothetical protein
MLSTQNKSFFLLVFLTVGSLYTALVLTREINPILGIASQQNAAQQQSPQVKADAIVDTKNWKIYEDDSYPLEFKYPENWTITTYNSTDQSIGYIIILKPNIPNADNIRIYINNKGYVATQGLTTEKTTINGTAAITVNDMLYGMRQGDNFLTFDLGTTNELLPYFKALMQTVEITE